jgi:hypothetical protein
VVLTVTSKQLGNFVEGEMAAVTSVKDASDPVGQFRRMMLLFAREIRGQ